MKLKIGFGEGLMVGIAIVLVQAIVNLACSQIFMDRFMGSISDAVRAHMTRR